MWGMCGQFMGFCPTPPGLKSLVRNYKVTTDVANLDTCFHQRRTRLHVNVKRAVVNPGTWVLHGLVACARTSWQTPNPIAWCGPSSASWCANYVNYAYVTDDREL